MRIKTMLIGVLALGCACALGGETKELGVKGGEPGVAVQKLLTCDFLLNKDFKKNAKYYLCLFSASWCGPCRREMPRIAKTYAESLKADPNIELIHFSRDREENKALAWAKEHNVKFPVVKYNGGNPLDLHARGIPHLFIVDADGRLIEEGHPAKLFTDEKLNALKAGTLVKPETATEKARKAIAKLFPGWSLDSEVPQGDSNKDHWPGFHASHRGQNNIIRLHPVNRETPVVLSRTVKLSGRNPCLSLSVSSWNDDADFLLSVRVNGKDALTNRRVCTTDAVPWEDIVVPLSPWCGSSVKLEIILSANNWWCEWSHLARVDIVDFDGDMSINEGKCEVDGYTWSYRAQNGEAMIVAGNDGGVSAVSPCPVGSITIPTEFAGVKVTHIGSDAFRDCSALTSVAIPEGVVRIGRGAFYDCTGLKSIKIPSSVKIIERDAFAGCNALSSVLIPDGVTIIDRGAFCWCCGLESIEIPSSVTQIGRDAFSYCKGVTSVTISGKVVDIGSGAFHGCNALASVPIPASVTNIDCMAFRNTGALTSFQVEPSNRFYKSENGLLLTKDGTTLVRGVNGNALIPPRVTAIGPCAFEGCVALRSIVIPPGVKSIGPFAFKQCRGMKSVTIPESVTDIGQEAFSNCKNLKSIAIPQGVTVIRNSTFSGSALTEAVIPSNVKVLERGAFSWCGELKSVTFPDGLLIIGRDSFYNCGKLASLTIPSSVRRIEQGAFHGCGSLTSVTMRGERPYAPNDIFMRCGKLKAIHVPANAKSWAGMKDWFGIPLVFGGESKAGDSWNSAQDVEYKFNYKLDDKGNAILTGVSPKPEGALVCPNIIEGHKVTGIDRGAFNGCDKMTKIMLPEHLETLPVWVSGWCIHGSIFYGCTALSSIGISETNPKFASVDGALYSKDKKVLFAYPKDRTEIKVCRETTSIQGDAFHSSLLFKKINIPEGISYTGGFAFSACPNLEEVIFPKEFGSINHHAFFCCPKMKKVVFLGDAPEAYWRRTASRENVFYGAARDIVVYVRKGSKGWNGKDSTDLPGRWPLDGSDSRPIRYINETDAKSLAWVKAGQGIPLVFDADDDAAARSPADMNGVYCVIDISGGSNAEHYPVSYLDSVPEGGWGDEYKTTKIVLRRVAAGTYPMLGNRKVTFTKPFYIGIFELTQKQIKLLSGDNNRKFVFEGDMRPADCLTWDEMRGKNEEFDYPKTKEVAPDSIIGKLRAKTGFVRIDLPTSYQFGCAWNAGTDGSGRDARSTGRHYSNQRDGKGGYTSKHTIVGSYLPNEWGIYDLHGNVWEMCLDRLVRQEAEVENDPLGPIEGAKRYLMGGCWNSTDGFLFSEFIPQNKEANGQTGKTGCRIVINVEMGKEAELRRAQSRKQSGAEHVDASTQGMNVVTKKLQGCDFLLNKDFKKNAKYYLCLFSASWCGPCRAEMPRIAKTYAESLKDDPDIELIHFSWDQDDEKALAWAKEHDVKFPVVKPKGGNPLDLHTRGIPHLFILKADGVLVEEGHPMKLFTDEKLRELKAANGNVGGKDKPKMTSSGKETVDGVEWSYSIIDGQAQVDYALSSNVTGSITIPSTLGGCPVTSIRGRQYGQRGVFEKCGMTSVTIPSSVTSIGDRAFENCRGLSTVTIQSSATSIGSFAFFGCDSLVSLVIPSGVTSIGCRAFACCRGLTSVAISSSVKRIEREAFLSCNNLMSISVEPDNPSYSSRNGLLCTKDGSTLVAGVNGDVTIPSGVTRIGDGAFDGYGGLTSVTIPSSVTRIGGRAFAICCGLTSVTIPSSVTSIGSDAFMGTPFYRNMLDGMVVLGGGVLCGYKGKCPSAITIPSNVTSIADAAFSERILRQYLLRRDAGLETECLKTVVISAGVTNIGNCAFSYCSDLENVTMCGERPDAPNDIFQNCGKLKSIHVPANAKSWAGMKEWQGIPLVFDAK